MAPTLQPARRWITVPTHLQPLPERTVHTNLSPIPPKPLVDRAMQGFTFPKRTITTTSVHGPPHGFSKRGWHWSCDSTYNTHCTSHRTAIIIIIIAVIVLKLALITLLIVRHRRKSAAKRAEIKRVQDQVERQRMQRVIMGGNGGVNGGVVPGGMESGRVWGEVNGDVEKKDNMDAEKVEEVPDYRPRAPDAARTSFALGVEKRERGLHTTN